MAGAALSGCTFTPAYAPGGPAAALQGAVRVDSPDSKNGSIWSSGWKSVWAVRRPRAMR
ncbi:hypothetical protein ACFSHQ_04850 [Gemmobacter lanyuensis]